jgi:hypothetical protein
MMNFIDNIVEVALTEEDHDMRSKLILGCTYYSSAMKVLTVYCIFSDDELELFQELIDYSVEIWIDVFVDTSI